VIPWNIAVPVIEAVIVARAEAVVSNHGLWRLPPNSFVPRCPKDKTLANARDC